MITLHSDLDVTAARLLAAVDDLGDMVIEKAAVERLELIEAKTPSVTVVRQDSKPTHVHIEHRGKVIASGYLEALAVPKTEATSVAGVVDALKHAPCLSACSVTIDKPTAVNVQTANDPVLSLLVNDVSKLTGDACWDMGGAQVHCGGAA